MKTAVVLVGFLFSILLSWAKEEAVSSVRQLRVQSSADLKSPVLGYLEEGERVEIIERGGFRSTIDGLEDYWYKVKPKTGSALFGPNSNQLGHQF